MNSSKKINAGQVDLSSKQDQLTAGTNISIVNNVISSTGGGGPSGGGNATVDNFYYQISNSVDTRPVFSDANVTINWDETGNDLEFVMKVDPVGPGDMRSRAYIVGGASESTAITELNFAYDIFPVGVGPGDRMEAFVTAENDINFPAYHITVYNTGETYLNSIWIRRITRFAI